MSDEQPAAEVPEVPPEHPLLVAVREGVPGLEELAINETRGLTELSFADRMRVADVCRFLRDSTEHSFELLMDIVAIDYWDREPRFGLAYNLYSVANNQRVFLKIRVPSDDPYVPTVTGLWSGANWMEREAFDMMGIRFQGHPDLRKILTPDDLEGHPLRKDFPLGNVDVWPEGADTNIAR